MMPGKEIHMESRIRILDEHTINQIAAGEVIEDPSSVVKELIENSLDAGATRITIQVRGGGLEGIAVTDNGRGIPGDQVPAAFTRYGTSKLETIEDLYRLDTMGFRGEALASIAAVARVTLKTRRPEDEVGTAYVVEGGAFLESRPEALRPGTTVLVEKLFFNAPVRQKFLRGAYRETRSITEIAERIMLSRPDVAMELFADGRLLFQTRGDGNLREMAAALLGGGAAGELQEVSLEEGGMRLWGLAGRHTLYRGSRDYLLIYINGRFVKSRSLSRAVEEAYKNRLPLGHYPVGILYLEIPSWLLEINVHPRKMEVRIDGEEEVLELLRKGVSMALEVKKAEPVQDAWKEPAANVRETLPKLCIDEGGGEAYQLSLPEEDSHQGNLFYPLRILGVVEKTYILAMVGDVLHLFDQHAVHERINFEKAQEEFRKNGFRTQLLLEPVLVELSPSDGMKITEQILALEDHGVLLEAFGESAFLIRGLPLGIQGGEAGREFLLGLADRLASGSLRQTEDFLVEKASCVRSVKAGESVPLPEMEELIYTLGTCGFPHTCPHGRPTFLVLDKAALEKMFLRSK